MKGTNMQVNTCIRELLDARAISPRRVSAELGRSSEYVRNVSMPTRSPALATVADVADVLGYDLVVRDRETGEDVGAIEAPRRLQSSDGVSED